MNRVEVFGSGHQTRCNNCTKPILLDRPVNVSQDDFDETVLAASVPVLVDFYADWCAPCKMVAPLVDELAREQSGRMLVVKIDTDRAANISERYSIRSIPTLVLFKEGKEIDRSMGFEPERVRILVEEAVA
ncbi:MAG: thioredoxin [Gemmatimonadetes bacterium]|nr:thioredoxin [Gemmatimonadota bacterium]MEC7739288.1 thioredoxin [Gemmatimonadota bacterium]